MAFKTHNMQECSPATPFILFSCSISESVTFMLTFITEQNCLEFTLVIKQKEISLLDALTSWKTELIPVIWSTNWNHST